MAIQFGIADLMYGGAEVGCLQSLSLDFSFSTAALHCGNALYASDIRTHSGEITGSASYADINALGLQKLLGASLSGSELTLNTTSKPVSLEMVVQIVTDGVALTLTFPKVRTTKFALSFVRDGHLIPNFDFSIEATSEGVVAYIEIDEIS
jgi:hypothetical protein